MWVKAPRREKKAVSPSSQRVLHRCVVISWAIQSELVLVKEAPPFASRKRVPPFSRRTFCCELWNKKPVLWVCVQCRRRRVCARPSLSLSFSLKGARPADSVLLATAKCSHHNTHNTFHLSKITRVVFLSIHRIVCVCVCQPAPLPSPVESSVCACVCALCY